MNIQEALASLDKADDGHWTTDGLPRIDVVSKRVGTSLKRGDITNAAPDFTRASVIDPPTDEAPPIPAAVEQMKAEADALLEDTKSDEEREAEMEAAADAEVAAQKAADLAATPIAEPEVQMTEYELLQEELEVATERSTVANRNMAMAKEEADAAANAVNALNRRLDIYAKKDPNHGTKAIRDYLNQQNKNRLQRAEGLQAFMRQTGVAPADVAKAVNPSAPIDQAMRGRKPPRGAVRPQFGKR